MSDTQRSEHRARRAVAVTRIQALGSEYFVQRVPPLKVIGIARRLSAFANSTLGSAAAVSRAQKAKAKARQKAIDEAVAEGNPDEETQLEAQAFIVDLFSPLLDSLARMPEDDQNYIIEACLRCVNDPLDKANPCLWNATADAPAAVLSAGDVLVITAEVMKIVLPELWGELQQVMGSIAAMFIQGAARADGA